MPASLLPQHIVFLFFFPQVGTSYRVTARGVPETAREIADSDLPPRGRKESIRDDSRHLSRSRLRRNDPCVSTFSRSCLKTAQYPMMRPASARTCPPKRLTWGKRWRKDKQITKNWLVKTGSARLQPCQLPHLKIKVAYENYPRCTRSFTIFSRALASVFAEA